MELMGCVRRNVDGVAGPYDGLLTAKRGLDLALEQDERLFEIMAMGWRAAPGRNMHIDKTKAFSGGIAGQQQGVSVSHDADVNQVLVLIGLNKRQKAVEIVGRHRR